MHRLKLVPLYWNSGETAPKVDRMSRKVARILKGSSIRMWMSSYLPSIVMLTKLLDFEIPIARMSMCIWTFLSCTNCSRSFSKMNRSRPRLVVLGLNSMKWTLRSIDLMCGCGDINWNFALAMHAQSDGDGSSIVQCKKMPTVVTLFDEMTCLISAHHVNGFKVNSAVLCPWRRSTLTEIFIPNSVCVFILSMVHNQNSQIFFVLCAGKNDAKLIFQKNCNEKKINELTLRSELVNIEHSVFTDEMSNWAEIHAVAQYEVYFASSYALVNHLMKEHDDISLEHKRLLFIHKKNKPLDFWWCCTLLVALWFSHFVSEQ